MARRVLRLCARMRFHVGRSYGHSCLHSPAFATEEEVEQVMASNPGLPPEAHRSLNFIVWRKSILTKLCAVFCIHTLVSLLDIVSGHSHLRTLSAGSCDGFLVSYVKWRDQALDPKNGTERLVQCRLVERWLGENLTAINRRSDIKIPLIGPKIHEITMRKDPKLSCADLKSAQGDACKSTFGFVTKEHTFDFSTAGCPWPDLCKMPFKHVCPEQCASGPGELCRDPGGLIKSGYPRFSAAFSKALYRSLQAQAARVSLVRRYLMATMNFCGGCTLYLALTRWSLWAKSQRYLIASWCLLFLAPFALSSVPIRVFLDIGKLDRHIDEFTRVSSDYWTQDDYGTRNWHKECEDLRQPAHDTIENWKDTLADLCEGCEDSGWSTVYQPSCYLWGAMKSVGKTNEMHYACNDFLEKGTPVTDRVQSAAKKLCTLSKAIGSSSAGQDHRIHMAPGSMLLFSPQVAGGWDGVKTLMEAGVGMSDAVAMFAVIAPAALSVAPAMIGASLFVKRLLPESSLPGVMIVLMPWLYTPMMWAFCNGIAQCNGGGILSVGLVLISFAPMLYSGLGWSRSVVAPMNQERAKEVLKSMALITNMSILLGLICTAIGAKQTVDEMLKRELPDALQAAQEFVLKQVLDMWDLTTPSGVLLNIVYPVIAAACSWYTKKTTIFAAAIDFIVQQITNQHQFDNMVMLKDQLQNEGMLQEMGVRSVINMAGEKDQQMGGMVELAKMR